MAFLSASRTEREAANLYASSSRSRLLADSCVNTVMAQITAATSRGSAISWSSQPGMIRNYGQDGSPKGYAKLYSWSEMLATEGAFDPSANTEVVPKTWHQDEAMYYDLNSPTNGVYPIADPKSVDSKSGDPDEVSAGAVNEFRVTGAPVATGAGANPLPMPVKWLYVLEDGRIVAPQAGSAGKRAVIPGAETSPIIGRIAFWTDDEASKVNLNTASEGVFWDTPRGYTKQDGTGRISSEFNLGYRRPLLEEYQRYPGHPATTSLSAVLGAWTPRPVYDTYATVSNYAALKDLYQLSPRIADGGSRGGTYTTVDQPTLKMPRKAEHLLASVDELLYLPAPRQQLETPSFKVTQDILDRTGFFLTTSSKAPETNLFNRPRVTIWPVFETEKKGTLDAQTASDRLIKFCSTIGGKLYEFQRKNNKSATQDFSGIARNRELYAYLQDLTSRDIPGFGGNFQAKYGVAERDQILTQIFEYIRCTNLNDPRLIPPPMVDLAQYGTYTETMTKMGEWYGWQDNTTSPGQVVPIQITAPGTGTATKGMGRFPVIDTAGLIFYCADRTRANSALASSSRTELKAALIFSWHHPMEGYMNVYNRFRIKVEALDGSSSVTLLDKTGGVEPASVDGATSLSFFGPSKTAEIWCNGAPADQTRVYGGGHSVFPSSRSKSRLVAFSATDFVQGSQAFTTITPNAVVINGDPHPDKVRWEFGGAKFLVTILSDAATPEVIQTITLKFPSSTEMPLPGPTLAGSGPFTGYAFPDFQGGTTDVFTVPWRDATKKVPNTTRNHRLSQASRDTLFTARKIPDASVTFSGAVTSVDGFYGDCVKGLIPVHSDLRLLACASTIEEDVYVPVAGYENGSSANNTVIGKATAHAFRTGLGFVYQNFYTHPSTSGLYGIGRLSVDVPDSSWGALGDYKPVLNPAIAGLHQVPAPGGSIVETPGDWVTGPGNNMDGAYFAKADEGNLNSATDESGARPPYYGWDHQNVKGNVTSPNLQIPSPVAFGSLATGVKRGKPWQTLLFRPYTPGSGFGPHEGGTSPRDHLLLDLFTMPVVEPYAISEPFATAGKVNLNYEIMPFRYVVRETGIRAVLQNERVTAAPSDKGAWKNRSSGGPLPDMIRFPVNVSETLEGFRRKFATGEIFRSASEICDVHIVPKVGTGGPNYDGMAAFWRAHALTGDNLKENPYARIYPRVTTKSNTFTVHYCVQYLKTRKPRAAGDTGVFDSGKGDQVESTFRGATTIERYVDPNDPALPDFATDASADLDKHYRFRTIFNKQIQG